MSDLAANRSNPPANEQVLVGIEIGGTKLQIVLGPSPTAITRRWKASADRAGGGAAIQRQIAAGLRELLGPRRPAAVGLGFGGPVDFATGRISRSHQIAGWEQFPLRDWLAELSGAPVVVENDSNTAALGEAIHGVGRGLDPVFYANFGSGVGGGLVINKDIYHGAPPGEIEFGHLRLRRDGTTVEDRCSGWAVDLQVRRFARENPSSAIALRLGQNAPDGGEARHLGPLALAGDAEATAILQTIAQDIAFALSHVVHLIHPSVIVIGGGLSLIGDPLRAAIEAGLAANVMEAFLPPPPVKLAELGQDAVPIGALELASRIAKIT